MHSHTNRDGLCALIVGHVNGGSGTAGKDDQWRVQEIHLDQDVMGRGTVMVAHVDLDSLGKFLSLILLHWIQLWHLIQWT